MLCQCGCGLETRVAKKSWARRGYIAGQPKRFCDGHRPIKHGLARRGRLSPSYTRIYNLRRRVENSTALGDHNPQQLRARFEFFGWKCRYCGKALTEKSACAEHMIPLSRGGTNWASNIIPSCRPCNTAKKDR